MGEVSKHRTSYSTRATFHHTSITSHVLDLQNVDFVLSLSNGLFESSQALGAMPIASRSSKFILHYSVSHLDSSSPSGPSSTHREIASNK